MRTRNFVASSMLLAAAVACSSAPTDHGETSTAAASNTRRVTSPYVIQSISGHFSPGDRFQHAIALADGKLQEIYFDPTRGIFRDTLAYFGNAVAIASYDAPSDGQQHVIVVDGYDVVREIGWDPKNGIHDRVIARFIADIADVGAFHAPDDGSQHALVATTAGDLYDLHWQKGGAIVHTSLGSFPGLTHVAGSYNADDHMRVAIYATSNGDVHELYYPQGGGGGNSVIAHFDEAITDVTAYFSPDDNYRHAIVATAPGHIYDVYYHPAHGISKALIGTVAPNPISVGAYFTATDNMRHVIVGLPSGEVKELYYKAENTASQDTLATMTRASPWMEDLSPDAPNGVANDRDGTAGRMVSLAGGATTLYGVGYASSVWRAVSGGPWAQLASAPRYAQIVAVDPKNEKHLVVGERNGDGVQYVNRVGAWESNDGGNSWSYVLNPFGTPNCLNANEQYVGAVGFSRDGTAFAGTHCGLFRKGAGDTVFKPILMPASGSQQFTAVVPSDAFQGKKRVWARTLDAIFVSENDGVSWQSFPIPPTVDGINIDFGYPSRDMNALAVSDTLAMMLVDATNGAALNLGTHAVVLSFDLTTKTFRTQVLTNTGNGTGLGGRRIFKSFIVDMPSGITPQTGLLFGTGQDIARATIDSQKNVQLIPIGAAEFSGATGLPKDLHDDIWDLHAPPNWFSGTDSVYAATDGGIYMKTNGNTHWTQQNHGLHALAPNKLISLLQGHTKRSRLAFTNGDNDSWQLDGSQISSPALAFAPVGGLGDSSWCDGDRYNPSLAWFARHGQLSFLSDFGHPVSGEEAGYSNEIYCEHESGSTDCEDDGAYGPQTFHIIQTLPSEVAPPLMDAVMLVTDPSKWAYPLPKNPNGGPILLRNRAFAAHTKLSDDNGTHWQAEVTDLPAGTKRFWVSGGHTAPVYFAYAETSSGTAIYRRVNGAWQAIDTGSPIVDGANGSTNGPIWVHPYDPSYMFVLTKAGIRVGTAGGNLPFYFSTDSALTQLVTGSGTYPLAGDNNENGDGFVYGLTGGQDLGSVADIAFDPEDPRAVAVASPWTGVFYAPNEQRLWQSLTPYLPKPLTQVSGVAIDFDGVSVAMNARSVVRVHEPTKAPGASYFYMTPAADYMATLYYYQAPITNAPVSVVVTRRDGTVISSGTQTTDSAGRLAFPDGFLGQGADVVVHLSYGGTSYASPAAVDFAMATPNPTPETLTVVVNGGGSVSGGGIACQGPKTCSGSFAVNATVTLTASAPAGWTFGSWSGACAGSTATCTVKLDAAKSVTATFSPSGPQTKKLTVTLVNSDQCDQGTAAGSVASVPAFLSCQLSGGSTTCSAAFDANSTVALTATPGDISKFLSWGGACSGSGTGCNVAMTSDQNVTATFCGLIP